MRRARCTAATVKAKVVPWRSRVRNTPLRAEEALRAALRPGDGPGEAELMTVRIGHVEEPLPPFGVAGGGVGPVSGRYHARIEGVDIGIIKDDASPTRPCPLMHLRDEFDIARARPEAREIRVIATVDHLKSEVAIEAHRARHVVRGKRYRADVLDHCNPAVAASMASPRRFTISSTSGASTMNGGASST